MFLDNFIEESMKVGPQFNRDDIKMSKTSEYFRLLVKGGLFSVEIDDNHSTISYRFLSFSNILLMIVISFFGFAQALAPALSIGYDQMMTYTIEFINEVNFIDLLSINATIVVLSITYIGTWSLYRHLGK